LRALADWLVECEVEEVVMESTAQYWRPVWEAVERYWRPRRRTHERATPMSGTLHLAQAQSNRGAGGRKKDFPDAERLVKRLVAQELTLGRARLTRSDGVKDFRPGSPVGPHDVVARHLHAMIRQRRAVGNVTPL
jgi:hypothetical protein